MNKMIVLAALVATQSAFAYETKDVPFKGYAEAYAEVVNHVSCFPHGIDMIGSGKVEAGMELWSQCWDENLESRLNFVQASNICPGEGCTFLADRPELRGAEMRAALVQKGFANLKFTSSHHQLDTLHVEFDGPDNATVAGKITATHFSDHQGPETHFVDWTGTLVKTDAGWRITEEDLTVAGYSVLPKAPD